MPERVRGPTCICVRGSRAISRSSWGGDFAEEDRLVQQQVATVLYEQQFPFFLASHPTAPLPVPSDTGAKGARADARGKRAYQ